MPSKLGERFWSKVEEFCDYGHEFTDENTYRHMKLGQMVRACRACNRRRTAEYRARKRVMA